MSEYNPMNTIAGGDSLPKRGPGRPKGVKNKPKEQIKTEERVKRLFDRVSPYLSEDQRLYIQEVIDGASDVDCAREMELLVRQMSLLFSEAASWWFEEGRINGDLAKFADSLRMAVKDLSDLREKSEEKALKREEEDGLVQLTERGTAMERIAALVGGAAPE